MITVQTKIIANTYSSIEIKGHANSAEKGKDLVCAAISAIATGALNAIDELLPNDCDLKMETGYVFIAVKQNSEQLQIMLQMLMKQLETVAFVNKKYIKMKQQEV